METPNIICIDSTAFYQLIHSVVERLKEEKGASKEPEWISEEETMAMLGITAKSTLQKFRDEGRIRYSKTTPKTILYYRQSVTEYINGNAQEVFR